MVLTQHVSLFSRTVLPCLPSGPPPSILGTLQLLIYAMICARPAPAPDPYASSLVMAELGTIVQLLKECPSKRPTNFEQLDSGERGPSC